MDLTASFIDERVRDKTIILTGFMLPISINKVKLTFKFSQAIGFLNANVQNGVYISITEV